MFWGGALSVVVGLLNWGKVARAAPDLNPDPNPDPKRQP